MRAPILFCHYGKSDYLKYSLKAAKNFNPEKRVVLLGDKLNVQTARDAGVEHFYFSDYAKSDELNFFSHVYQHVAGEKHGREFWTRFVFERWFYIHSFLKKEGINSFWHFDSDTLILTALEQQEKKYIDYDCTEQCNYACMSGLINSFRVVDGYVKKINELFQTESYLNYWRRLLNDHPAAAFTEMGAYYTYVEQSGIKTIRLHTIINNETFDDCMCKGNGMETYPKQLYGQDSIKKIYYSKAGIIYCRHLQTGMPVIMNSLNMSWLPAHLYSKILRVAKKGARPVETTDFNKLRTLNIKPGLFFRLTNRTMNLAKGIIRTIKK